MNIFSTYLPVRARLQTIVVAVALALLSVLATVLLLTSMPVSAACDMGNLSVQSGADCAKGNGQPENLFAGEGSVLTRVTSILLFIIGAVAVIMLIIGGIRYVVSGGDQSQVTAAKNTILYAIIGIVVAVLAYAAVRFVTTTLLSGAISS